jgi:hypothetical protein
MEYENINWKREIMTGWISDGKIYAGHLGCEQDEGIFLHTGSDEDENHRNGVGILLSKKVKNQFNWMAFCMRKNYNCTFKSKSSKY